MNFDLQTNLAIQGSFDIGLSSTGSSNFVYLVLYDHIRRISTGFYCYKLLSFDVKCFIALFFKTFTKGQLISKAIYGVLDSPKKRTKKI